MKKERVCDCGAAADWEQVGSTWICVACKDRDVKKNMGQMKKALKTLERSERTLHMLRIDTASVAELLNRLQVEIDKIEI